MKKQDSAAGARQKFPDDGRALVVVDWDQDGKLELLVGADQGFVWYFKPEHFGEPAVSRAPPPRE